MKRLNIAFVADYNCGRVKKEATALRDLGHNIILITAMKRFTEPYSTICLYESMEVFESTVWNLRKSVDFWHVHSEPMIQVQMIRAILPKARIIASFHDSNYWYYGRQTVNVGKENILWYDDDVAVSCADGFVVPSPEAKKELAIITRKPIIDLPPACPAAWYVSRPHGFRGGLVNQGGHIKSTQRSYDRWRDYTDLYKQLRGKREVFAYCPLWGENNDLDDYYIHTGAKLAKYGYKELIGKLGEHSWNLVGNLGDHKVFEVNIHNKLFDGLAAGIPSVVFGSKPSGDIVLKYDIGIVCKTVDELLERWNEHPEKRKNAWLRRKELSMENYIGRLEKLYERFL